MKRAASIILTFAMTLLMTLTGVPPILAEQNGDHVYLLSDTTETPLPSVTNLPVPTTAASSSIEKIDAYGNFETAGIDIKVSNMNSNETATIEYKKHSDSTYMQGYPFTTYDANHMATSLFNLSLNTQYDVRVTLNDPDGVVGTNPYTTSFTTKSEYVLPIPLRIVNVTSQSELNDALSDLMSGDEINIASGIYTSGVSLSTKSGTAEHPIVFTSQGLDKPLFSNCGFSLYHSDYIVINNLEIHNELGDGVHTRGCHDMVVRNCYIHDSAPSTGDYTGNIMITHGDESNIQGRAAHLILNNILSDEVHGTIDVNQGPGGSNNPATSQCYDGVNFEFNTANGFTTIRGNTIYGVVDALSIGGDEGWAPDLYKSPDSLLNIDYSDQNLDVYDNSIYNVKDDCIQQDGHMVNSRIFRNRLGRCQCSISTAPFYGGPTFIIYNYVYDFNEQCAKINTSVPGESSNAYFFNNTFIEKSRTDGSLGGGCYIRYQYIIARNFVYKNNIFYAQGRIYNGDMFGDPEIYYCRDFVFDYNNIYSTRLTDSTLIRWVTFRGDPVNNTYWNDYESWRQATGQEVHGVYGDPLIDYTPLEGYPLNSGMVRLSISENSPSVDKGVLIPGINDKYYGAAPDCGAFEFGLPTPTPTPTITPTNTPTVSPSPSPDPYIRGTITLQQGTNSYIGAKDVSYIAETGPNSGYYGVGQSPSLYLRDNGLSNALIYFDLEGQLPTNIIIDTASISFYHTDTYYDPGIISFYRIQDPDSKGMWVEGASSDSYSKDGASWLGRAGTGNTVTVGWTNTVGSTIMNSANAVASATMNITASAGWKKTTDISNDVQEMVNGTAVNQGWYIRMQGSGINIPSIASCQNATGGYRPKLSIAFHSSGTVTPTNTPVVTITPLPTVTATPTSTSTPMPTNTALPTNTPAVTVTPTPSSTSLVLGDVNLDGRVTSADALMALQAASGRRVLTSDQRIAADVIRNGSVTSADALRILQFASGRITSF